MAAVRKTDKGLAVISLTAAGSALGSNLIRKLGEGQLFLPIRLQGSIEAAGKVVWFESWEETFAKIFKSYSRVAAIMAAGIVVRSLAPLMVSKVKDPAIVVLDEKGKYAVSLLSGHIGGANQLARQIAGLLGGEAVITTATDVQDQPAVDLLAREMNGILISMDKLKVLNRILAERQEVNLYSPWRLSPQVEKGFVPRQWTADSAEYKAPALVVSHYTGWSDENRDIVQIRPRNLILGIGCRKGVSIHQVENALFEVVQEFKLDPECIIALATIDLKKEEAALQQLALKLELPIICFSKKEIDSLEGSYPESALVKQKVGVGGVCEPAALLASRGGITLVPKQKKGPVTISVAMEKSWWWDWGQGD